MSSEVFSMNHKSKFVRPEIVRLPLSNNDWMEVKKRLSLGEQRAVFNTIVGEVNQQGWRRPNVEMMGIAELLAYLVAWSLRDDEDRPVPISAEAIKALDPEAYEELDAALAAHIEAMAKERSAEKNAAAGSSVPSLT
jgi:hypothetical protein